MADNYTTRSTSLNTAIVEDIEINVTKTTRRVLRVSIIENNPKNPEAGIGASIIHQRKKGEEWEDIKDKPLSSLKAGEMAKLTLSSGETLSVFKHLERLYALHKQKGVAIGESTYVVGREDEIIKTTPGRANVIKKLIEIGYSKEVWDQLIQADPDLATRLSVARLHHNRQIELNEFSTTINGSQNEGHWQKFFEKNKWIFGYGLDYRILKTVADQPNYGGQAVSGKGGSRGDFLKASSGIVGFTVLVEIKTPSTQLLEKTEYRNGIFSPSKDLVGGISQLRGNAFRWQGNGSKTPENQDLLEANQVFTVQPKKILVIGNTNELKSRAQREAFELFRRNQGDVEILTFDELLERAKFILSHDPGALLGTVETAYDVTKSKNWKKL